MSDSPAKRALIRILKGLPGAIVAPFLLLIAAVALLPADRQRRSAQLERTLPALHAALDVGVELLIHHRAALALDELRGIVHRAEHVSLGTTLRALVAVSHPYLQKRWWG